MTAQIPDRFLYASEEYDLIGLDGSGLIDPEQFGIEPEPLHTACWRGFHSTYTITSEAIFLEAMTVRAKNGVYPAINGVSPRMVEYNAEYEKLGLPVPFSGKMRLAKGFIEKFYVHMGFQKASAYRTVLDLSFEEGRLVQVADRSQEMKAKRGQFKKGYGSGDLVEDIEDAFSLDMEIE